MEIQTPAPVDVSRLKNILGNAKMLMKKVDSGDYETGHIDARALTEDGVQELQAEGVQRPASMSQPSMGASQAVGYTEEMVRNSRLPEAVKKAMIANPIQQPSLSSLSNTFSLDDVSDLVEKPMGLPNRPKTKPRQRISESTNDDSDLITISRSDLDAMIDVRLLEFFTKTYNKMITEDTIKKTINTLVKEGKLTVKKKTI